MRLIKFFGLFLILAICFNQNLFAGQIVPVNENINAYFAQPEGALETKPGIILVHEWWGLNDQMESLADEFSKNGYAALAVDLYRGKSAADPGEAHELMRGLPDDRALTDLKAAVSYLSKNANVDAARIAVIGWCMGGGYALRLAVEDFRIKAVVVYYGKLITDEKELTKLNAPLLGFFGAEDRGISPESVEAFKNLLDKLNKRNDITIYPEAGHAFANPDNKDGYREQAAKDAWGKTLNFLKANLG